ncbi:MAG: efflux RND transporter periplasmic adaptor subunit, partial [Candidatus Eiseniibacteriota bacterium]
MVADGGEHINEAGGIAHASRRSRHALWIACAVLVVAAGLGWAGDAYQTDEPAAPAAAPPLPQVTVSKPLSRPLDTRLGFLGQFAAVDRVELRAQVGGTLMEIHFKDGDIVHKGDVLFTIDPVPYQIKLEMAEAQLSAATARLALAERELYRARTLKRSDFGTAQNVDQRTADLQSAQAAIDDAKAQIRDAKFDIDHCRVVAPFTGRIGAHLVSVGSLIAGSRAATSPTTLLATLVSLDPIYLNFDMSEADYLKFTHYRAQLQGPLAKKVEFAIGDADDYSGRGTLDFVDNAIDRSSGTIRARATVPNPDLRLTPGEFARLRVVVAPAVATLLVPDSSVLPDQSQHIVMTVAADGTVVPKIVQIGDLRGGLRVIRSGLSADDRVIVDGLVYA